MHDIGIFNLRLRDNDTLNYIIEAIEDRIDQLYSENIINSLLKPEVELDHCGNLYIKNIITESSISIASYISDVINTIKDDGLLALRKSVGKVISMPHTEHNASYVKS